MKPSPEMPTVPEPCERVRELLSAAHDGEGALDATAAEHIRQCAGCAAFRGSVRELARAFEPLRAPVPLPPGLWSHLEARAIDAARPRTALRSLASLGAALVGAAAVLALFLALGRERASAVAPNRGGALARPFELLELEGQAGARIAILPEIRLGRSLPHRAEEQR
jgi:predicted anti-sigma-YlaC factor YlaD